MDVLILIDMQKDFIDGALGSPEAQAIVPYVAQAVRNFDGALFYTQDSHDAHYLETAEGQHLPIPHCQKGSAGWALHPDCYDGHAPIFEKPIFASLALADHLQALHETQGLSRITLMGLCTDICVLSNALLLKTRLPEVPIAVDPRGCAGSSPEAHAAALLVLSRCHIDLHTTL